MQIPSRNDHTHHNAILCSRIFKDPFYPNIPLRLGKRKYFLLYSEAQGIDSLLVKSRLLRFLYSTVELQNRSCVILFRNWWRSHPQSHRWYTTTRSGPSKTKLRRVWLQPGDDSLNRSKGQLFRLRVYKKNVKKLLQPFPRYHPWKRKASAFNKQSRWMKMDSEESRQGDALPFQYGKPSDRNSIGVGEETRRRRHG